MRLLPVTPGQALTQCEFDIRMAIVNQNKYVIRTSRRKEKRRREEKSSTPCYVECPHVEDFSSRSSYALFVEMTFEISYIEFTLNYGSHPMH
jgi:hypothetical protein